MSLWNQWFIRQPSRGIYTKFRHFEFEENINVRPRIQNELAKLIYNYHIRSRSGINLLPHLGYPQVAKAMREDQRPSFLDTQKAHLIEILACEFARFYLEYDIPVFRFYYNLNPEQSMKGDDILGFDFSSTIHNIIVGEAKYRGKFSTDTVEDMYNNLSKIPRPHPISIEFFATILEVEGDMQKAQKIRQVRAQLCSDSPLVQRNYLLVLATEGKPRNPFEAIQNRNNVLENLTAVNIVFQKDSGIDQWINNVYKQEIEL